MNTAEQMLEEDGFSWVTSWSNAPRPARSKADLGVDLYLCNKFFMFYVKLFSLINKFYMQNMDVAKKRKAHMTLFAKIAMVLSLAYYALSLGEMWIGQLLGFHNDIWELYDFPAQDIAPPTWAVLIGLGITFGALLGLGFAYRGVWAVLNGGREQDFRDLVN